MKKSKMTLSIALGAIACTILAGCDNATYSPEGYILTYTNSAGETMRYTAEDLFGSYYNDSGKVSTMFDSIYKVIVRNYFTSENAGYAKYSEILKNAKNDVEGVKSTAEKNADTNSTSYDEEWDALLKSNNCDNEEELLEKFIYDRELTEFNDQFYEKNTDFLRDAVPSAVATQANPTNYEGYLYTKAPYHVRHILVKVNDSGSTNYWNSTIDESNAIKLYDVASALANGGQTFGKIAQLNSDDSSASSYGDLGIMDKDTGFVNEFKLGIYAYENIYNNITKTAAAASEIAMNSEIVDDYKAVGGTTIAKIPYGAFVKLYEVKDVTKDNQNRDVNDGNANFYPRNVYFNKYLNKHYVGVITPDDVEEGSNDYSSLAGFKDVNGLGKVLCTSEGQPILVVRAGTSDYQGIHFIVIERSPLISGEVKGTTLSEYYTTKYPSQEGYPVDSNNKPKQTYVNFLNQDVKAYKERATTVENKIKGFDTDLNKFIYSKYVSEEKIKFNDAKLEEAINNWIDASKVKKAFDADISWEQTWDSYIESLKVQNNERSKLIPEVCAIGFKTHTGADWVDGGVCYDNKNR